MIDKIHKASDSEDQKWKHLNMQLCHLGYTNTYICYKNQAML
jgi:hypothetical protein